MCSETPPEPDRREQKTPSDGVEKTGSSRHRQKAFRTPVRITVAMVTEWWNVHMLQASIFCSCGRTLQVDCPMQLASKMTTGVFGLACMRCKSGFIGVEEQVEAFADSYTREFKTICERN
jgi:hypothetical protein